MSLESRVRKLEQAQGAEAETEVIIAIPGQPGRNSEGLTPEDAKLRKDIERSGADITTYIIHVTKRGDSGRASIPKGVTIRGRKKRGDRE